MVRPLFDQIRLGGLTEDRLDQRRLGHRRRRGRTVPGNTSFILRYRVTVLGQARGGGHLRCSNELRDLDADQSIAPFSHPTPFVQSGEIVAVSRTESGDVGSSTLTGRRTK